MALVNLNILDEDLFFRINSSLFYMARSIAQMNYPCHYMVFDTFNDDKDYVITARNELCNIKVTLPIGYPTKFSGVEIEIYRNGENEPFISYDNEFCLSHRFDYIHKQSQRIYNRYLRNEPCLRYSIGHRKHGEIGFYYKDKNTGRIEFSMRPHIYETGDEVNDE